MPSACFKCVNKLAFLQLLLFASKHAKGESTEKVEKRDFEPLETAYCG